MHLAGKTLFITGATRGIGRAIALAAARQGANIALASRTDQPHRVLPGTLSSVSAEIEAAGGKAFPQVLDVRDDARVNEVVNNAAEHFGGIDICVNNASAILLAPTLHTPMKRFDLMHQVNVRGTFATSQACLPHLLKADNPHILTLSPPLNLDPMWFASHLAYTMSKYGMSMCVLGMAEEFKGKVAVNALWPATIVATNAVSHIGGDAMLQLARKPEVMADAAIAIFARDTRCSGNFFIDEDVLRAEGVTDLSEYSVVPGADLAPDLFL